MSYIVINTGSALLVGPVQTTKNFTIEMRRYRFKAEGLLGGNSGDCRGLLPSNFLKRSQLVDKKKGNLWGNIEPNKMITRSTSFFRKKEEDGH